MPTDKINYNEKKEQAMLAVIHQLDLKDNNHGLKDVVAVLAEFWNNAVKLAEFNARSDTAKQIFAELADKKLLDISHYSCDDSYYACPKTKDGEDYHGKGDCNCGAERRIKEVEEIKKKYKVNEKWE